MSYSEQAPSRHGQYGQHWGEGAARCFSIEGDFLNEDQAVRLMPVPECFVCPISAGLMRDPVATVDGCAYEREHIERWFRERRQHRQEITSPITGLDLPSATLMPLVALQKAIEAYLAHRPELKLAHMAGRSFEEAATILQTDFIEKQVMHSSAQEEIKRLRQANRTLRRALLQAESVSKTLDATRASAACSVIGSDPPNCVADAPMAPLQSGASPPPAASSAASSCVEQAPLPQAAFVSPGSPDGGTASTDVAAAGGSGPKGADSKSCDAGDAAAGTAMALNALAVCAPEAKRRRSWDDASSYCRRDYAAVLLVVAAIAFAAVPLWLRVEPHLHAANGGGGDAAEAAAALPTWPVSPAVAAAAAPRETADTHRRVEASKPTQGMPAEARASGAEGLPFYNEVQQLWSSSANERQRAALRLRNLAADSVEDQAAILRAGALAPLVRLLRDGDPGVREEAARALWNLARSEREVNGHNQWAIAQAGAIEPLILLLEDIVPRVRVVAAAVLNDLAIDNPANQVAIARAGAITPLIELLKNDDAPSLVMASGLLQSLASQNADPHVASALASAIPMLVDLLSTGSMLAQEEAALTLGFFATCGVEIQTAIARAGAVKPLVGRLEGDLMQGTAALALRNLAAGNAESQATIAQAGAVGPLVRLLDDSMPGVREEAARTLMSLGKDNLDHQLLIMGEDSLDEQLLIMGEEGVVRLADVLKGAAPGARWSRG